MNNRYFLDLIHCPPVTPIDALVDDAVPPAPEVLQAEIQIRAHYLAELADLASSLNQDDVDSAEGTLFLFALKVSQYAGEQGSLCQRLLARPESADHQS